MSSPTTIRPMSEIQTPDPPYKQLAEIIRKDIRTGSLKPGDPVPTTRELTVKYDVAMSTAARALALLRDEGWTISRPSKAAIVAPAKPREGEA